MVGLPHLHTLRILMIMIFLLFEPILKNVIMQYQILKYCSNKEMKLIVLIVL